MAWTDVRKISDEFDEDGDGLSKARRIFYAASDVPATPDDALAASFGGVTVTARGQAFSSSRPRCIPVRRHAERINRNNPFQFEITIDFEDPTFGPAGASDAELLATPAKIDETKELIQEEYTLDASEPPKPVMNTAREPFDKNPIRTRGTKIIQIRKYVTPAMKADIEDAEETTNKTAKTIRGRTFSAETLVLENASFDEITPDAVYMATITIKFKKDGWKDVAPNVGYSELAFTSLRKDITQKDKDGNDVPVIKPWPLNEDGTKYPSVLIDPIMLTFKPYAKSTWAGVPLS